MNWTSMRGRQVHAGGRALQKSLSMLKGNGVRMAVMSMGMHDCFPCAVMLSDSEHVRVEVMHGSGKGRVVCTEIISGMRCIK